MKWTQSDSGHEFKEISAGAYPAICYRIIDLGTQETSFQGKTKFAHKVLFMFETNELMQDGRPYVMPIRFTVSFHEKANLRHFLSGWRGRDFTEEELQGFDPRNLLDKSCLLTIIEKAGKTYIQSASRLPKGLEAPKRQNELLFLSLDEFDQAVFDKLSPKLQETIKKSPEYRQAISGGDKIPESNTGSFEDFEDDFPF